MTGSRCLLGFSFGRYKMFCGECALGIHPDFFKITSLQRFSKGTELRFRQYLRSLSNHDWNVGRENAI